MSDTAWETRQAQGSQPTADSWALGEPSLSFPATPRLGQPWRRKIPTKASSGPTPFCVTRRRIQTRVQGGPYRSHTPLLLLTGHRNRPPQSQWSSRRHQSRETLSLGWG